MATATYEAAVTWQRGRKVTFVPHCRPLSSVLMIPTAESSYDNTAKSRFAVFDGDKRPTELDVEAMHHESHADCYIANSVKTEVLVQGRAEGVSV